MKPKTTAGAQPPELEKYQTLQNVILGLVELYGPLMGLHEWKIKVKFAEVNAEDAGIGADCVAEPEYYNAEITFYLGNLAEREVDELPAFVRHEMLHILMWPFGQLVNALTNNSFEKAFTLVDERVTSDLERMPIWELVLEDLKGTK